MSALALLENNAKTAAKSSRTGGRLRARGILRDLTSNERLAGCGFALGGEVHVQATPLPSGSTVGMAGLKTCGSVWACPVCSAKIAMTRTNDMEDAIVHWATHGNSFVMLTLTMQHRKGQSLRTLWDGLSGSWRRFVSDGTYKRTHANIGSVGYHRTTEITQGANGWHVHLHVLYFIEGRPADLTSAAAGSVLTARWIAAVEATGLRAVSDAQDWKILRGNAEGLAAVAGYVHKSEYVERASMKKTRSMAMELTRGDLKVANSGSRTPFEILADIVASVEETGEIPQDDFDLWSEYEEVSRGRRQQVWSRGMRERLGMDEEVTDEEAAEIEAGGESLVAIPSAEWRRFARDGRNHAALLDHVSTGRTFLECRMLCAEFLRRHGVEFRLLDQEVQA